MTSMNAPRKSKPTDATDLAAKKPQTSNQPTQNVCNSAELASSSRAFKKNQAPAGHTKIVVKCNCGFPNNLFLRGEGIQGLSWNKGQLMKCTKADEWVWETDAPFNKAQIKVLINDNAYELGENHSIDCGKSITFSPRFM